MLNARIKTNKGAWVWGVSRRQPSDLQMRASYTHLTCALADRNQIDEVMSRFSERIPVLDRVKLDAGVWIFSLNCGQITLLSTLS